MSNNVILNQIRQKLSSFSVDGNSIVVLKGIPLSLVDSSAGRIDLSNIVSDKMGYFMSIYNKRKFLTYEEFLLMSDFIVAQYKQVYLLDNNIYMEQYLVEECFDDDVRTGLLSHFSESESEDDDDCYIGDIDEYIAMFVGLKEYHGSLVGVYSEVSALSSNKVLHLNLFDNEKIVATNNSDNQSEYIEIIDESDYLDFIKLLLSYPDEIHLRISNYTGDINKLQNRISIVAYYWNEYTDIYYVGITAYQDKYVHRQEFTDILKHYWGYDSYRNLSVYDLQKLDQGEKIVTQVSQEAIIANLVEEVENCEKCNDFRDVFVTAPTGGGKSVMFQVPAIYLAENYNLLTIVISPLIGLMNDQVKNLELVNYSAAKTINSDISPILKQDIIEKVGNGQYHILYISPETLLSRSDVEQLIGDRTIGMIVIDEAHIVTTWGKQFRPDYWYLGDHIRKLRKKQMQTKHRSFIVATFTATAIYHGLEDMYTETINSLHMINPITYLGYVKRNDIEIVINHNKKVQGIRTEYELDKFVQVEQILRRAIITNKKTLIYFPTVALIERCFEYLRNKNEINQVAIYHGSLCKEFKQENYDKFLNKEKLLMLATKAFGMGIDINDIEIVAHFAPTGNVCDYVQEIGRAARREDLHGEALYNYNKKDFKHINRLHGLSTIQKYQLIKVIEKIDELYQQNLQSSRRNDYTKRRNAMLLDAENFGYIFGSPVSDEDDNANKVKTALLLIQKDFESKIGFSPITVRPIPMFSVGFFQVLPDVQSKLLADYPGILEEIEPSKHICRILLSAIWNKKYKTLSFPKFKYLLYLNDTENLDFVQKYPMKPALCVNVAFDNDYISIFTSIWSSLKNYIDKKVISSEHTAVDDIVQELSSSCGINKYKAQTICEVVIASMDSFRKKFSRTTSPIVLEKTSNDGKRKYQFNVAVNSYFAWVESGLKNIVCETNDGKLYLINDNEKVNAQFNVILGILESMSVLTFEMIGGANSQLYIYINQIQSLKNILNSPYRYANRLLDTISERHLISVKMLTYLYEGEFNSDDRWNIIEDYFLGTIPEIVKIECKKEKPDIIFD